MRTGSLLLCVLVAGCGRSVQDEPAPKMPPPPLDPFHARLLDIAARYKAHGRFDDETRWAPGLCRSPLPSMVRFSASGRPDTHGQKLYYVFARQRDAYLASRTGPQPAGQVLVKESWTPEEVARDLKQEEADVWPNPHIQSDAHLGSFLPYARKEGRLYRATERAGLFIMYKTDGPTPDTDEGWVYGTVSPDGKTVTSAGRVASCMACHQEAKNDRLFGLSY